MNAVIEFYKQQYQQHKLTLPGSGSPVLSAWRDQAAAYFLANGFPNRHQEDWKYTSLYEFEKQSFTLRDTASTLDKHTVDLLSIDACQRLVFIDGHFSEEFSCADYQEVEILSLAEAFQKENSFAEKITNLANNASLVALNNALMQSGAVISIKANAKVTKPLQLLFITTEDRGGLAQYLRNVITLEKGASADVIIHQVHLSQVGNFSSLVNQIFLAEESKLNMTYLFDRGKEHYCLANTFVEQAADSQFATNSFLFEGKLIRHDIDSQLLGEHASCKLKGLYYGSGKNHFDQHITVNHQVGKCISEQIYKGILTEQSRAVFNGKVIVAKDAQKSDALQSNQNLLLSRQAEVDTKPELEIYADDVKCAHGATIGQLSDEALFYLISRGIAAKEAKEILTYAFGEEMVEDIKHAGLKGYVSKRFAEIINF